MKNESEVAQLCPTLCDPMNCSLPDSSINGIFQARILQWVSISFSRRSSQPRDWTRLSHIVGRHFTISVQFSVTQSWLFFETPWIAACQASMSITNSRSSLKLMSIELVMPYIAPKFLKGRPTIVGWTRFRAYLFSLLCNIWVTLGYKLRWGTRGTVRSGP